MDIEILSNTDPYLDTPIPDTYTVKGKKFNLKLDHYFKDDDGDALGHSCRLASGDDLPEWLTFNPLTYDLFSSKIPFDAPDIELEVSVTDILWGKAKDTFWLRFVPNNFPYVGN